MVRGEEECLRTMGRRLTNREIYMYFKDRIVVKSHKLAEVITKHRLTSDCMAGLDDPDSEIPIRGFAVS